MKVECALLRTVRCLIGSIGQPVLKLVAVEHKREPVRLWFNQKMVERLSAQQQNPVFATHNRVSRKRCSLRVKGTQET
jgi:hypothetical protein